MIVDGKARLAADNLCDGLGNCLGKCPKDAITVEEREADEFDEDAVEQHKHRLKSRGGKMGTVPDSGTVPVFAFAGTADASEMMGSGT